jgi:hypothetical protein
MKRQPLRPGEGKILTALLKSEKTNGELQKETGLQSNILIDYLRNLQRLGFVERDIDSRKYRANAPISAEVIFFNEVLEFIRTQFAASMKLGNEKAGIIPVLGAFGWVLMNDKPAQNALIEKHLKKPKVLEALSTISSVIDDSWKEYYLSTLDRKDKQIAKRLKIIEEYELILLEIAEHLNPLEPIERNKNLFSETFEDTKKKMQKTYPGIDLPEAMIKIEADRRIKEFSETHSVIMTPTDLSSLYALLETYEKTAYLFGRQKDLTENELETLERKIAYLKNPKIKKLYEDHLNHLRNKPKSLLFYSSWGFKEYPQKLESLIPKTKKELNHFPK